MDTTLTTIEQPAHHTFGPSTFKWRAACPGWHKDDSNDQTAADEGTMLHKAVETRNYGGLNDEQLEMAETCANFVDSVKPDHDVALPEQRLEILGGITFGTADQVLVNTLARTAKIIDFKFGFHRVEPARMNKQGWAYAVGVFGLFPDVESVEVVFIQPRIGFTTRHTFTRKDDLPYLEAAVRAIIAKAQNHTEADLYPTEEGCAKCGARGECPALRSRALTIAKQYCELEIVEDDEIHSSALTDPNKMAKIYAIAQVMEKWADSVKQHAKEMVMSGQPIPGFVLRERRGVRKITNPIAAWQVLREIDPDIAPEQVIGRATLSASALEELVTDGVEAKQRRAELIATLNQKLSDAEAIEEGAPIIYLQKSRT